MTTANGNVERGVTQRAASHRDATLLFGLFVVAAIPLFVALYGVPVVPSHDGPRNLYSAHIFAHADDPAYRDEFARSYPVTALGSALVYGALETVLPWRWAYATALAFGLLTMPIGVALIARNLDPRRTPIALAALGAAYGWTSHMGFINYVGSVGLGFVALGLGLIKRPWSLRRELGVYAALLAASVYHPFGGQFAAVGLFAHLTVHATRGSIVRRLGGFFLGATPVLLVTLLAQQNVEAAARGSASDRLELSAWERMEGLGRWFLAGPAWRSGAIHALVVIAVALLAFRLARRCRSAGFRNAIPLLTIIALGLAGVALLPMHSPEWQFFQPRFNALVLLPWLPLVPLEVLRGRLRVAAVLTLAAWALASNAWVAQTHRAIANEHPAIYGALHGSRPAPGRSLLPIIATQDIDRQFQRNRNTPIPHATHLDNVGFFYAIDRAAVSPYGFTSMQNVHLVTTRPGAERRAPARDYGAAFAPGASDARRSVELARLATYAPAFDDVLFYGAETDAEDFLDHGFEIEHRSGGFFLGSYRGCPASVHISGDATRGTVHLTFPGAYRVVASQPLPSQLPAIVPLPRASCLGVRVLVEASDAGGRPLSCREAVERPNELRTVASADGERTSVCTLEP